MGVISSLVAGTIGTAALLGAGTVAAIAASQPKKKAPPPPAAAELPTPKSAEELAKAEVLKKRKIIARTGGKTILTSQYGGNVDTATKTLLGQ